MTSFFGSPGKIGRETMPLLLNDPAHWHLRAQETRHLYSKILKYLFLVLAAIISAVVSLIVVFFFG
jgi:hypothetical protein